MRDKRLGGIVNGLVDGDVDDVGRDARRNDQVAKALPLEELAGVLGAKDDAVHVDARLLAVLVEGRLGQRLADGRPRVGDEAVHLAAQVGDDLVQGGAYGVGFRHVDLVGAGADAVLLREGGGLGDGGVVGMVPEGDVGAGFSHALDDCVADAVGGAVDDYDAALHGELVEDIGGDLGDGVGRARVGDDFIDGHGHGGGGGDVDW